MSRQFLNDAVWWIIAVAIAAALTFVITGCGNQALRINATVARAMLTVQSESGPLIRELRVEAGIRAGREAHDRGQPEAVALADARAATDRWECAVDGHRIFALAVGSYIDALALWQADTSDPLDVLPFARRVLEAYRFLHSCLASLGSTALPEMPSFMTLIPAGWSVQP